MSSGKSGNNRNLNRSLNVIASPKNTLLNYFSKSPSIQKGNEESEKRKKDFIAMDVKREDKSFEKENNESNSQLKMEIENEDPIKNEKQSSADESDDSFGDVIEKRKGLKRRRFVLSSSEEESDTEKLILKNEDSDFAIKFPVQKKKTKRDSDKEKVDVKPITMKSDQTLKKESSFEDDESHTEEEEQNSSVCKELQPSLTFEQRLNELQKINTERGNNLSKKNLDKIPDACSNMDEPTIWPHQKLEFLKADKIKDKEGRRPDHPDYDKTTLYVPKSFLDSQSPV